MTLAAMTALIVTLLCCSGTAAAGSEQKQNPHKGGQRMLQLLPHHGQHLPDKALERGAPHVLHNVQKNPRSPTAHQAIDK